MLGWQVSPQEASDYEFEFASNEWLARKYSFRCNLAISQGYGAVGIQWHIGGGCYVITNAQDAKAEHEIELNSRLPVPRLCLSPQGTLGWQRIDAQNEKVYPPS